MSPSRPTSSRRGGGGDGCAYTLLIRRSGIEQNNGRGQWAGDLSAFIPCRVSAGANLDKIGSAELDAGEDAEVGSALGSPAIQQISPEAQNPGSSHSEAHAWNSDLLGESQSVEDNPNSNGAAEHVLEPKEAPAETAQDDMFAGLSFG